MARSRDPDSAGSQFFICLGAVPQLNGQYTAFGQLTEGDEVLGAIGDTPTMDSPSGEKNSRPTVRVGVTSIRVESAA
jgi:cyclophilin family peptidyl-prolyl cis-trans isomerase